MEVFKKSIFKYTFTCILLMNRRSIIVKAIINKKNGQINFSLPKKKISNSLKTKIIDMRKMKIKIEDLK